MGKSARLKRERSNNRYYAKRDSAIDFQREYQSFLNSDLKQYLLVALASEKNLIVRSGDGQVCIMKIETFEKEHLVNVSSTDFLFLTFQDLLSKYKEHGGVIVIYQNRFKWMEGILITSPEPVIKNNFFN